MQAVFRRPENLRGEWGEGTTKTDITALPSADFFLSSRNSGSILLPSTSLAQFITQVQVVRFFETEYEIKCQIHSRALALWR